MKQVRRFFIVFFILLFRVQDLFLPGFFSGFQELYGQQVYPSVKKLNNRDEIFKQFARDVTTSYRLLATGDLNEAAGSLLIYSYKVEKDMDILDLAARCNILYDSIASLNSLNSINEAIEGKELLLPTVPGLFIPEDGGESAISRLLAWDSRLEEEGTEKFNLKINGKNFIFLPAQRFNTTQRAFFLNTAFLFPLDDGVLTSPFGKRKSPFTGKPANHKGIDLAAPEGSPVYASRAGTVEFCGYNEVYGNHIIIRHDAKWSSLYGHLSEIKIRLHQKVKTGYIIGSVGSTGQSTGPHLHFEIQEGGTPLDPQAFVMEK